MALILEDGQADPMITDKDGYSSLHLAVESGNINSIKLLLEAMKTQFTASGWAELLSEAKTIASRNQRNGSIAKFIDRWNVPLEALLKGEPFPIHAAVNLADLSQLESLIKTFNINERDATGETGLHHAARHGLDNVITFLLANGASVSISSRAGYTALDLAIKHHHNKR